MVGETVLPFSSATLWMGESLLTRSATPRGETRDAPTTFSGAPEPSEDRTGASPAPPMSAAFARSACNRGAAAEKSDHSILYGAPLSAPEASSTALF